MLERSQKERHWRRIYRVGAAMFVVLLSSVMLEMWFAWFFYSAQRTAEIGIVSLQAEAVAYKIGTFIRKIESQLGWTTQLPLSAGTIEQRRTDGQLLLRQVPAITTLIQLDSAGREQLRTSRLGVTLSDPFDYSQYPEFMVAVAKKVYYGPVYFLRESEPSMKLAVAGTRRDAGVSVAEVNLKFMWDVVSQTKVGQHGQAYVTDAEGRLIAHPDIGLVLRNTDMTRLAQVKAARAAGADPGAEPVQEATDINGRRVLIAHAPVMPLGWLVFVELPVEEAYAPLYAAIERSFGPLLVGLTLAFFGIAWFSWRSRRWVSDKMAGPSEAVE